MDVTYAGPFGAVEVDALRRVVQHRQTVTVPDEIGVNLLEQPPWTATAPTILTAATDAAQAARLLHAEQQRSEPRQHLLDELAQLAEPAELAAAAGDEVPDAKVDVVLAWVGDDRNRAERALAVERRRDTPRTTLVERLELLLATASDTTVDTTTERG